MKINTSAPVAPRAPQSQLPTPAPTQPVDQVVSAPQESGAHKAFRVLTTTVVAAGLGGAVGYLGAQGGGNAAMATAGGALMGGGYGTSAGWQAGKKWGLQMAGGKGNDVAKGIGALTLTFGGPLAGGVVGLVGGAAAAAMGGPIVTGALFGAMALTRELCRD